MGKFRCTHCDFHCNKWHYYKNHVTQIHKKINIGILANHQIHDTYQYFLTPQILKDNNLRIAFVYKYDDFEINKEDLKMFDSINVLIIDNDGSLCKTIIKYIKDNNLQINLIKICEIEFPIFPLNWNSKKDYARNYKNWKGINKINFTCKFNVCIKKLYRKFASIDYDENIIQYIKDNFSTKLLFTGTCYPTNHLINELWKCLFKKIWIKNSIDDKIRENILKNPKPNPYTTKMISDLNIKYFPYTNDKYYNIMYTKNYPYFCTPIIYNLQSEVL